MNDNHPLKPPRYYFLCGVLSGLLIAAATKVAAIALRAWWLT